MARRHKRVLVLSDQQKLHHINGLTKLREQQLKYTIALNPTSDDYQQLQKLCEFLNSYIGYWTGNPDYFKTPPNNWKSSEPKRTIFSDSVGRAEDSSR